MKIDAKKMLMINDEEEAVKVIENTSKWLFFFAGLQVLLMYLDCWQHIVDVIILALCGYFLWSRHSRGAAIVLLALSIFNLALTLVSLFGVERSGPNNIVVAFAVLYISIRALVATFLLQDDSAVSNPVDENLAGNEVIAETAEPICLAKEKKEEISETKDWYVLVGAKSRAFSPEQVKELYEAKKVKIRGPYQLDEIIKYHDGKMLTDESILFRKGDKEWQPFERYGLKKVVQTPEVLPLAKAPEMEWFVLVGIKNKMLTSSEVEGLFNSKKVQIKGPLTTESLVAYFKNNTIDSNTIVNKKGDQSWMPLASHKIKEIDDEISVSIFGNSVPTSVKTERGRFWSELGHYVLKYKKTAVIAIAAICVLCVGYDFYTKRPEQIYKRINKNVVLISSEKLGGVTDSLGTGFILENSDIITTNYHVIGSSTTIRVKSGEGLSIDIDGVVYVDPANDIALLKIKKMPKGAIGGIPRGDSNKLSIGERVYTIGNPAGLEFSLSEGLVSGKRTTDPRNSDKRELIQITAPISPGNSGGPLLDKRGRVIGITTLASNNNYQNLNFAIPISLIKNAEKNKEIMYKFLPSKPKWTHLATKNQPKYPYDSSQDDGTGQINHLSYDPGTVVAFGDQRRRFWAQVVVNKSYYMSDRIMKNLETNSFLLVDLDCKKEQLKFNFGVQNAEGKSIASESDFSEDGEWTKMSSKDKELLEPICNK